VSVVGSHIGEDTSVGTRRELHLSLLLYSKQWVPAQCRSLSRGLGRATWLLRGGGVNAQLSVGSNDAHSAESLGLGKSHGRLHVSPT
jgi:hypothetical protein